MKAGQALRFFSSRLTSRSPMLCPRAIWIALRNRGFAAGSPPPIRAAMLISFENLLQALAKLSRRGTIKPGWIVSALKMAAVLRSRSPKKGERRNEKD